MKKDDFLKTIYIKYQEKNIPKYEEIEDISENQVKIKGEYQNPIYTWGIYQKNNTWYYVETDDERGYLSVVKNFETEDATVQYVEGLFKRIINASEGNTDIEMAERFIQNKYDYSEKRAKEMVIQMLKHQEIFEEFLNYMRIGKFRKRDRTQTDIQGYTAERLNNEYKLSPLGAYNYLVYLAEEPKSALADLKKQTYINLLNKEQ